MPVQFSHGKDSAMVLDGENGFKVSTAFFQKAVASAVDRSTIVSYWQRQPRGKPGPEATCLLDMKAGSSDMIAGAASEYSGDDVAGDVRGRIASKFSLDEEDNPVVSDGIRTLLSKEAKAVLENLQTKASRVDGRRLCPMCPFGSFAQLRQLRTTCREAPCVCKPVCVLRNEAGQSHIGYVRPCSLITSDGD